MKCFRKWDRSMAWTEVLTLNYPGDDFVGAQHEALKLARETIDEPMIVAWYDRRADKSFPDVECCSEQMPGWLVYARSRGGRLIVDVNDGEYIFVFV